MNNGCYIQNTYKYAADKDERILFMNDILTKINDTMYTYILLVLLAGAGIYFTVRTKGVQLRLLGDGLKCMLEKAPVL